MDSKTEKTNEVPIDRAMQAEIVRRIESRGGLEKLDDATLCQLAGALSKLAGVDRDRQLLGLGGALVAAMLAAQQGAQVGPVVP